MARRGKCQFGVWRWVLTNRLRSIGKSGFRILKWNAKSENRWKRISSPRNPFSWKISSKKSKSGFHGSPFYRSIGKSKKGFAKLFSWTEVFFLLIMRACVRRLFVKNFLSIPLSDFRPTPPPPKKRDQKKWNLRTDISAIKSVSDFAIDCKSEIRNPDLLIERTR